MKMRKEDIVSIVIAVMVSFVISMGWDAIRAELKEHEAMKRAEYYSEEWMRAEDLEEDGNRRTSIVEEDGAFRVVCEKYFENHGWRTTTEYYVPY